MVAQPRHVDRRAGGKLQSSFGPALSSGLPPRLPTAGEANIRTSGVRPQIGALLQQSWPLTGMPSFDAIEDRFRDFAWARAEPSRDTTCYSGAVGIDWRFVPFHISS